jgi:cytochrome c biogenesis protein CcdA/thiol-disulfide isomerase/thioredoxin
VLVLIGVGLLAGLVTSLSPCVLPVLPIVLAGGATGRRPLAIVAGLVVSFSVFTLFAVWLLDRLGLPEDLLRNIAIVLLLVVAATLLVPRFGELVSRPLERLSRRPGGDLGGGFLLGASLGLVFVPCAGPVLSAITFLGATNRVGAGAITLTLAYAIGAAIPLLGIAFLGARAARPLKAHAVALRRASGALIAVTAVAIALGTDQDLQTKLPGYTEAVNDRLERSTAVERELGKLTGARRPTAVALPSAKLPDYGEAPGFHGIDAWLNSRPLALSRLRGKVVLIDFWTYSCINCLRTLPHVKAWDARYRADGLVIVGVHTPEFAFEHKRANVAENVRRLAIRYPVALDNGYGTWNAWRNQYWPAKYLIDRRGHVRYYHYGEGDYDKTEAAIRDLLAEANPELPQATSVPDGTPSDVQTPETYLGFERLANYAGSPVKGDKEADYSFPLQLRANEIAYAGRWRVGREHVVAGGGARLRIDYHARRVFLVLGGLGNVDVLVDGKRERRVRVDGDRLYTLVDRRTAGDHLLELRFSPGLEAYAFTFG